MKLRPVNIVEVMEDPQLFGQWFEGQETWHAWTTFLRTLFALPMDEADRKLFSQCTGRQIPPDQPCREAALVCGRRAGKSFIMALIGAYLACFRKWGAHLMAGEVGTIPIIAADRAQARTVTRYLRALVLDTPMLAAKVTAESAERIEIDGKVCVEVHTASFRRVRGYTVLSALLDEVAFWKAEDSAEPDHLILDALRPAMATIPDAMLLMASSPWAKRGVLYDMFRQHFGRDGDPVLVWRAPTDLMNPSVPAAVISDAYERDAAAAACEYGAQFRADIEGYVSQEAVEACITPHVIERPPVRGVRYTGFTDVSAGSSDSFATAIAHVEDGRAVLDAIRETSAPFSPQATVEEHAKLLREYNLSRVEGDRFAGQWPIEVWRQQNIQYKVAKRTKTDIYRDALPKLNTAECDLLDVPRLKFQLLSLERRTIRGTGREIIDHVPGAKDDVANAALGAILSATTAKRLQEGTVNGIHGNGPDEPRLRMVRREDGALVLRVVQ